MKNGLIFLFFLFTAAMVLAGGFQLSVESGSGRNEALIIKTFGCQIPSDAKLNGTAEGIVNGERKTVKLKFKHDQKGVFTVSKQWEDEGVWVIIIKGKYNGINSSAIVEIDSDANSKFARGETVYNLEVTISQKDIKNEEVAKLLEKLNQNYTGV